MKKWLIPALCLVLALSMAACGTDTVGGESDAASAETDAAPAAPPTPAPEDALGAPMPGGAVDMLPDKGTPPETEDAEFAAPEAPAEQPIPTAAPREMSEATPEPMIAPGDTLAPEGFTKP